MKKLLAIVLLLSALPTSAQDFTDSKTPYIVTFWFNTCKYCIQEMDAIAESFGEWNDRTGVRLYAVCTDSQRSVAKSKSMVTIHDWGDFDMIWDINGDLQRKFNVVSYPYLLLFAPDGNLLYSHVGYSPGDEDKLWKELEQWSEDGK